jgi:hypothetical protein
VVHSSQLEQAKELATSIKVSFVMLVDLIIAPSIIGMTEVTATALSPATLARKYLAGNGDKHLVIRTLTCNLCRIA